MYHARAFEDSVCTTFQTFMYEVRDEHTTNLPVLLVEPTPYCCSTVVEGHTLVGVVRGNTKMVFLDSLLGLVRRALAHCVHRFQFRIIIRTQGDPSGKNKKHFEKRCRPLHDVQGNCIDFFHSPSHFEKHKPVCVQPTHQ